MTFYNTTLTQTKTSNGYKINSLSKNDSTKVSVNFYTHYFDDNKYSENFYVNYVDFSSGIYYYSDTDGTVNEIATNLLNPNGEFRNKALYCKNNVLLDTSDELKNAIGFSVTGTDPTYRKNNKVYSSVTDCYYLKVRNNKSKTADTYCKIKIPSHCEFKILPQYFKSLAETNNVVKALTIAIQNDSDEERTYSIMANIVNNDDLVTTDVGTYKANNITYGNTGIANQCAILYTVYCHETEETNSYVGTMEYAKIYEYYGSDETLKRSTLNGLFTDKACEKTSLYVKVYSLNDEDNTNEARVIEYKNFVNKISFVEDGKSVRYSVPIEYAVLLSDLEWEDANAPHKIIDLKRLGVYDDAIKNWVKNNLDSAKTTVSTKNIVIAVDDWENEKATKDIEISDDCDIFVTIPSDEQYLDNVQEIAMSGIFVTEHTGTNIVVKYLNKKPSKAITLQITSIGNTVDISD